VYHTHRGKGSYNALQVEFFDEKSNKVKLSAIKSSLLKNLKGGKQTMRNLKRVLSLALATVMLLGMMVMGTSAASVSDFNDSDWISNVEAATVTTGLGIFEGANGNFMPNEPVTRAQMATIIVKLLYGSDYNADSLKNITLFDDTHNYQGGWAEGYINMCAQLGIVNGYAGTKHFGPGDTVTTAQASLMLMKALGYFDPKNPNNEYGDSWEVSAMIKAGYLGLNGKVTMLASEELTRDNVALLVYNTLLAQQVSYQDSLKDYAKSNNHQITVNNGTVDETNTLLYNTFHVYVAEGTIVANGLTDEILAGKQGDPDYATVVFEEAIDLDKDGRKDYSEYDFMYDTGLDMIGHKVDVYYRMNRGNPEVLVMMDKATLVETIRYDADSTTRLANTANALGFRRNTVLNIEPKDYKVNYDLDVTAGSVSKYKSGSTFNKSMLDDKYIILISNSGNYQVDEIIVLDQDLDQVRSITRTGDYDLYITSNAKKTVSTFDAAVKDYVIVTDIGLTHDRYVMEPATVVNGNITKFTGVAQHRTLITASGVGYEESPVGYTDTTLDNVIGYQSVKELGDTTLILDQMENLVAVAGEPQMKDYAYVAQFGSQHDNTSGNLNTKFALTADVYFPDGTHRVMFVDKNSSFYNASWAASAAGNILTSTAAVTIDDTTLSNGVAAKLLNGKVDLTNGNAKIPTNNDENHYTWDGTNFVFTNGALGVYVCTIIDDNHIKLTAIGDEETGTGDNRGTSGTRDSAFANGDRFVSGHSTVVEGTGISAANVKSIVNSAKDLRQTNATVYFFVQGMYGDDAHPFSVSTFTDVVDMPSFTVDGRTNATIGSTPNVNTKDPGTNAKPYVVQMFSDAASMPSADYRTVSAALIANYGKTVTPDVYYYNKGQYTVEWNTDRTKAILTYYVWDKDGNETTLTYEKNSSVTAVDTAAAKLLTGYYNNGTSDLTPYVILGSDVYATNADYNGGAGKWEYRVNAGKEPYAYREGNTMYVVNAALNYEVYLNGNTNFFDNVTGIASLITDKTKIVDACNSGLESIVDIKNAFEENDGDCLITVSYTYGKDNLKTGVLYITSYTPASSTGTGSKPIVSADRYVTGDHQNTYLYSSKTLTPGQIEQLLRDYYAQDGGTVTNVNVRTAPYTVTVSYGSSTYTMNLHISMGKAVPPTDVTLKPVSASPASAGTPTMQDFMSLTEAEDTLIVLSGNIAEGIPADLSGVFPTAQLSGKHATQEYFTLGVNLPGVDGSKRAAFRIKSAANDPANWDDYPWDGEPGGMIDASTGYKYWVGQKDYQDTYGLAVLAFAGDVIEIEVMLDATGLSRANNTSRGDVTGVVEFTGGTFIPSYTLYIDTNGVTMVTP